MKTDGTGSPVWACTKRFLEHRYLPVFLAIGAILVMLPALKTGLVADDLVQRAVELRPGPVAGANARDGHARRIPAVSRRSFATFSGLNRDPQCMALAKNYGTAAVVDAG